MKKTVFAWMALAAAVTAAAVAQPAPITPEQTLDRRTIGDLEFSPDGSRLVFTVTEPVKGTARARALWLLEVSLPMQQASVFRWSLTARAWRS